MRELVPGLALFVGSALALGVIDVAYNWHHERMVGISLVFCWMLSMAAALLGAANTFAREQRQHLSFLGTWPVSRRQVWAAKVLVPVLMWFVLLGLSFGICGGLLAMRGYDPWKVFTDWLTMDTWIHLLFWVMLFGVGLLASTAVPSAIGAAAAALVLGGLLTGLYGYVYQEYIPSHLGPKLGLVLPDMAQTEHLVPALIVAAICVISSAIGFLGARMLETVRRGVMVAGSFVGLIAAAVLVSYAVAWFWLRPLPPAAYDSTAEMDGSGEWVLLHGSSPPGISRFGGPPSGPLWALDVNGGHLRLISRGPVTGFVAAETTARVIFTWRGQTTYDWVAELPSGRLIRLPWAEPSWGGDWWAWSPRGTYLARNNRDGAEVLRLSAGRVVPVEMAKPWADSLDVGERAWAELWAPDERELYVGRYTGAVGGAEPFGGHTRLSAVSVPGGEIRLVAELEDEWDFGNISPDGRWMAAYRSLPRPPDKPPAFETALIDLRAGNLRDLGGPIPQYDGWSPDGKYLWCYGYRGERLRNDTYVRVVEVATLKVIREIEAGDLGGWMPMQPSVSPGGDKVLIRAQAQPAPSVQRNWWLVDVDGGNLRRLDIEGNRVVGWTHDDDLIVQAQDNRLMRVDIESRRQTVIYDPTRKSR